MRGDVVIIFPPVLDRPTSLANRAEQHLAQKLVSMQCVHGDLLAIHIMSKATRVKEIFIGDVARKVLTLARGDVVLMSANAIQPIIRWHILPPRNPRQRRCTRAAYGRRRG